MEHSEYTEKNALEIQRCRLSPEYFIQEHTSIFSPVDGIIPFKMWGFQENLVKHIHEYKNNIIWNFRQSGISNVCYAYILWYTLFNSDVTVVVTNYNNNAVKETLRKISDMYGLLPSFLKVKVIENNVKSLRFINGSGIIASTVSSHATGGFDVFLCFCDNFAFSTRSKQEAFMEGIIPSMTINSKMIIASVPNYKPTLFEEMFNEALAGKNQFNPINLHWYDHPSRNDAAFKKDIISVIGEKGWQHEYGGYLMHE